MAVTAEWMQQWKLFVCSTVDVVVQDVIIRRNAFYRFDEHYHYQLTATGT